MILHAQFKNTFQNRGLGFYYPPIILFSNRDFPWKWRSKSSLRPVFRRAMFHPQSRPRWFNHVSIKPATSGKVEGGGPFTFFGKKEKQFPSTPGLVQLLFSKRRPYEIILGPISDYLETVPLPPPLILPNTQVWKKRTQLARFVLDRLDDWMKYYCCYIS